MFRHLYFVWAVWIDGGGSGGAEGFYCSYLQISMNFWHICTNWMLMMNVLESGFVWVEIRNIAHEILLMMLMVITHAKAVHPSNALRWFDDTLYQRVMMHVCASACYLSATFDLYSSDIMLVWYLLVCTALLTAQNTGIIYHRTEMWTSMVCEIRTANL